MSTFIDGSVRVSACVRAARGQLAAGGVELRPPILEYVKESTAVPLSRIANETTLTRGYVGLNASHRTGYT